MSTKSPMERLPSEVIHNILSQLDGVQSLRSAILSCHWLWAVFSQDNSRIITRVIYNQLDSSDVRPEALIAWKASTLPKPPTAASSQDICKNYLSARATDLHIPLTTDDAATITKFQFTVEKLADTFAKDTLQKLFSKHGVGLQKIEATASEKSRIMRALYRFEIFCKLFRYPVIGSIRPQREQLGKCMLQFLSQFSPWENEQLRCIYKFLFLKVSPAYNEIAEHDIMWGKVEVHPIRCFESFDSRGLHSILMNGLDMMAGVSEADTYARKYELMVPNSGFIDRCVHQLDQGLKDYSLLRDTDSDVLVGNYSDVHDYASRVKPPYFRDPDDGPFESWKWAYGSSSLSEASRQKHEGPLRELGYIMWDKERLDEIRVFQLEYQSPKSDDLNIDELYYHIGDAGRVYRESLKRRSKIYKQGGIGWWDVGDESKVVWLRGKPDPNPSPKLKVPVCSINMMTMSRADHTQSFREFSAALKF